MSISICCTFFISNIVFVLILFFHTQSCWTSAIWPFFFKGPGFFLSDLFNFLFCYHLIIFFFLIFIICFLLFSKWFSIFLTSQVECLVYTFFLSSFYMCLCIFHNLCLYMYILSVCVLISNYVEMCGSLYVIRFLILSCSSQRMKSLSVYFWTLGCVSCLHMDKWSPET